ncbi:MAG: hypothetical protein ABMB14_09665 [Myxococcota bacterium]
MAITLPRSMDPQLHSLEEEVARVRGLTPEQRLRLVALVCRSTLSVLNLHPKRDLLLKLRDPVPESTRAALRRLGLPR